MYDRALSDGCSALESHDCGTWGNVTHIVITSHYTKKLLRYSRLQHQSDHKAQITVIAASRARGMVLPRRIRRFVSNGRFLGFVMLEVAVGVRADRVNLSRTSLGGLAGCNGSIASGQT